ncbi:MAG: hypothetical protein GY859_24310, partial [Desulfobacterales bacterium]|nr:hypothetical protein [Desulfobacterales bacterium]
KAGFTPAILDGGVNLWRRKGGPLQGEDSARPDFDTITPREFFKEKDMESALVIDVSQKRSPQSLRLTPYAIHAPLAGSAEEAAADLQKILPAPGKTPLPTILVITRSGAGHERARELLANTEAPLFFLEGGLNAYKQYLTARTAAMAPRETRMRTAGGCAPCGGKRK